MAGKEIGKVTHWYDKIGVAVVKLGDTLKISDKIKDCHGEVEFDDTILSMQIDHKDVPFGKKGDEVAMKLSGKAKEGSLICKIE